MSVGPLSAMRIGVDNVVCAIIEKDNITEYKIKNDKVYKLPGVMTLNINPNASIETAFYDDGPGDVATTLGNIEVTFNKASLGPKEQALILGASYAKIKYGPNNNLVDANTLVNGVSDTPPWLALGFRTLKSDGTYKYSWLLKGKFTLPTSNNETKGESINFQSDEITGRFVSPNHTWKLTTTGRYETSDMNKLISPWKIEWDETLSSDATKAAFIKSKWFESVMVPGYADSTVVKK